MSAVSNPENPNSPVAVFIRGAIPPPTPTEGFEWPNYFVPSNQAEPFDNRGVPENPLDFEGVPRGHESTVVKLAITSPRLFDPFTLSQHALLIHVNNYTS